MLLTVQSPRSISHSYIFINYLRETRWHLTMHLEGQPLRLTLRQNSWGSYSSANSSFGHMIPILSQWPPVDILYSPGWPQDVSFFGPTDANLNRFSLLHNLGRMHFENRAFLKKILYCFADKTHGNQGVFNKQTWRSVLTLFRHLGSRNSSQLHHCCCRKKEDLAARTWVRNHCRVSPHSY